jgi:hypothetical protein
VVSDLFFLVKSKERSYGWLPLAVLGPFGLIILSLLGDNAPVPEDLYQPFVGKLKLYLRIAYELSFFVLAWVGAYQAMVLKRDLMIMVEAAATGTSTAQIIDQQNASSGMWAFGESLEVFFLVVSSICSGRSVLTWQDACPDYGPPPKRRKEVAAIQAPAET